MNINPPIIEKMKQAPGVYIANPLGKGDGKPFILLIVHAGKVYQADWGGELGDGAWNLRPEAVIQGPLSFDAPPLSIE